MLIHYMHKDNTNNPNQLRNIIIAQFEKMREKLDITDSFFAL